MRPDATALDLLSRDQHASKVYLFVQSGLPVWQGVATAVAYNGTGDCTVINFDTLGGSRANLHPNMSIWIGYTTNPQLKGNVRIVHPEPVIGANQMIVAPNSLGIQVGDKLYADWVQRLYPINILSASAALGIATASPRVAAQGRHDPYGQGPPTPYPFPPQSNMGPNRAAWTGEPILLIGSESWTQRGRTIGSHGWDIGGGTLVVGTGTDANIWVSWPTAGDYLIRHVVTDSAGDFHEAIRVVMVRDRPENVASGTPTVPYQYFSVESCQGDFTSGGWTARVRVYGPADVTLFPDGAAVAIVAEDHFGSTQELAAYGPYPGCENILMVGQIVKGSAHVQGADQKEVTFDIATWDNPMKELDVWPANFAPASSPDPWHNIDKVMQIEVLHHLLNSHSNVGHFMDIRPWGDTRLDYVNLTEAPLWDQISTQLGSARSVTPCVSRYGQLFYQKDANLRQWAERLAFGDPEMELDNSWWTDFDLGEERSRPQVSQLKLTAPAIGSHSNIGFPDDVFTPTYAVAAAKDNLGKLTAFAPEFQNAFGKILEEKAHFVVSQQEANETATLMLAKANLRYPLVNLALGNLRLWDVADQPYLALTLRGPDILLARVWNAKEFIVRKMEFDIDVDWGRINVKLGLEESVWGAQGTYAAFPIGAPPPGQPSPVGPPSASKTGKSVLACWKYGVLACFDIFASSPAWWDRTGNLASLLGRSTNVSPRINGVTRDVYGPTKTWWAWGHFGIAKTTNQGFDWTVKFNKYTLAFLNGWSNSDPRLDTFSVIRVTPVVGTTPGTHFAVVLTKHPTDTAYSQAWLCHTHDDWESDFTAVSILNGVAVYDPGNTSGPDRLDIDVHTHWPSQKLGYKMIWVATNHMDPNTTQLIRWRDGGHSIGERIVQGTVDGFPGLPGNFPCRVKVPWEGNFDGNLVYFFASGDREGVSLFKTTEGDVDDPTWTQIPNTSDGPSFGVLNDKPLIIFASASRWMRSLYGHPFAQLSLSTNTGTTWTVRNAPDVFLAGAMDFAWSTAILYAGATGFTGTSGMFWTTQDEGQTAWVDRSGNLNQLMLTSSSLANSGGIWCILADWTV